MKKHRMKFDPYKQAGRRLDQIVNEAVAYIEKVDADASIHADKRALMKATALGETRERIGEVLRGVKKQYAADLERSTARPMPKVNGANVAERTYWRDTAKDLFSAADPSTVPALLKKALLAEPGDVARTELLAAAERATQGAGIEAASEYLQVRERFSTEEERLQRNDHRAIDAAGFRVGLLDLHIGRSLEDLATLAAPPPRPIMETRDGRGVIDASSGLGGYRTPVVHDPEGYSKWANGVEKDADAAAESPPPGLASLAPSAE